ncbi:MAG: site-2 protease family protein [Methanobacterium sp. BRmetb2]|jgi:Zn-dependent protease|nr:MAG: site-2 protease family protein [Methanobacterium sp. BRmetb2]
MVKFTSKEIRDIVISMLVIALVFAYVFSNRNINVALTLMPITLIAVGLGFVLHELAHKFVAIRYGFYAEYKMWIEGLILALVTTFVFGIVFAAPGAVYIHGYHIRDDQNGKISIAGPLTNIALTLMFLGLLLTPFASNGIIFEIGYLGASVNSFLAVFNLIPISVLDGAKVFRWNPLIWIVTMAIAFVFMISLMFGLLI